MSHIPMQEIPAIKSTARSTSEVIEAFLAASNCGSELFSKALDKDLSTKDRRNAYWAYAVLMFSLDTGEEIPTMEALGVPEFTKEEVESALTKEQKASAWDLIYEYENAIRSGTANKRAQRYRTMVDIFNEFGATPPSLESILARGRKGGAQ